MLSRLHHSSRRQLRAQRLVKRTLAFEAMEDRCLMAIFSVTNLNDSGAGSLRQAIIDANSNDNPGMQDRIAFDASLTNGAIQLLTSLPQITQSLEVDGPVPFQSDITIDGQGIAGVRPFEITASAKHVVLAYLTITGGNQSDANGTGGGIFNAGPQTTLSYVRVTANQAHSQGGGVFNTADASLVIRNSEISYNQAWATADGYGGGVYTAGKLQLDASYIGGNSAGFGGGGVAHLNSGDVTIEDSTIAGNSSGQIGGGIVAGDVNISRSTIFNNRSEDGGGLYFTDNANGTVTNSTIVNNVAISAGMVDTGGGIKLSANATATIVNSTIVQNTSLGTAADAAGGISVSAGIVHLVNSVVAQNLAPATVANMDVDPLALATDSNNFVGGDPQLGLLQDNGGATHTMIPLAGSPLIDAGDSTLATVNGTNSGAVLKTDQRGRGFPRILDGNGDGTAIVDIGAVEYMPPVQPTKFYVVNNGPPNSLFQYDANGNSNGSRKLPQGNRVAWGIYVNASGTRRWIVSGKNQIFVYDHDGAVLGNCTAKGLAGKPRGIAVVGKDVYIVDNKADRVFVFAGQAGRVDGSANPTRSFALAGGNQDPQGITSDGKSLWIVNDKAGDGLDKVFHYRLRGALLGSWSLGNENQAPTGITVDPSGQSANLWVVDAASSQIFQYDNGVKYSNGKHQPSVVFDLHERNTNPQGIADPPVTNTQRTSTDSRKPTILADNTALLTLAIDEDRLGTRALSVTTPSAKDVDYILTANAIPTANSVLSEWWNDSDKSQLYGVEEGDCPSDSQDETGESMGDEQIAWE